MVNNKMVVKTSGVRKKCDQSKGTNVEDGEREEEEEEEEEGEGEEGK